MTVATTSIAAMKSPTANPNDIFVQGREPKKISNSVKELEKKRFQDDIGRKGAVDSLELPAPSTQLAFPGTSTQWLSTLPELFTEIKQTKSIQLPPIVETEQVLVMHVSEPLVCKQSQWWTLHAV